jgi:Retrotransposon gag protein
MTARIESLEQHIRQLQEELAAEQLLLFNTERNSPPPQPQAPQAPPIPSNTGSTQQLEVAPKGPKPGDPALFYGKANELEAFINDIQSMFRLQKNLFHTEEDKIVYATTFMRGNAKSWWIFHRMEWTDLEGQSRTWADFKDELNQVFGYYSKKSEAMDRMIKLRQEGSWAKIDDFLTEMTRLNWIAKCGEQTFKEFIRRGLRKVVSDAMIIDPDLDDRPLNQWMNLVRRWGLAAERSDRLGSTHQQPRGNQWTRRDDGHNPHPRPRHSGKPWKPYNRFPSTTNGTGPLSFRDNKRSMVKTSNQDNTRNQSGKPDLGATEQEKDRWAKERRCLRCGRKGHFRKDCRANRKEPPNLFVRNRFEVPPTKAAAITENDEMQIESENELLL